MFEGLVGPGNYHNPFGSLEIPTDPDHPLVLTVNVPGITPEHIEVRCSLDGVLTIMAAGNESFYSPPPRFDLSRASAWYQYGQVIITLPPRKAVTHIKLRIVGLDGSSNPE